MKVKCPVIGWRVCKDPHNCGLCPYFKEEDAPNEFVCCRCITDKDSVAPFYQEGTCDRCNTPSAVLVATEAQS